MVTYITMGITVEGQKCPVCDAYLFDSDDIVFCPECGAPHHRDCYHSIGHCARSDDHGTERQYQRPTPKPETSNTKEETDISNEMAEKSCPHCGSQFEGRGNICPYCGKPISNQQTPFGTPIVMFDAMGGVGTDETIDDIPATEVRDYVVVNTPRYLPRFKQLNANRKVSWNWAAFVFPHAWFFYRKIYLPGIFFFLLSLVTSAMTSAVNLLLTNMPDEALSSYAAMGDYIAENISSFQPAILLISMAGFFLNIGVRVAAALSGDWLYRGAALSRIRKIKETEEDENDPDLPLSLRLRKSGSVNPALGLLGLFALQWIVTLIYMFL